LKRQGFVVLRILATGASGFRGFKFFATKRILEIKVLEFHDC
jgi:hypothetical protein